MLNFFNIFIMILTLKNGLWLQIHKKLSKYTDFNKDFKRKNEAWNLQILWLSQGSSFWRSLLAFDAWFWCYLWCSRALDHFIVCIRCLILMLFVMIARTWPFYCLHSMLDFNAICGVPEHLAILLLARNLPWASSQRGGISTFLLMWSLEVL